METYWLPFTVWGTSWRYKGMRLRNKFFIQHMITIIMLLAAMYVVINYTMSKSMIERDTQTLSQYYSLHRIEALRIVSDKKITIEELFSGAYAPHIASHLASNSNFQVQLFDREGTIIGDSSSKEDLMKRNDIDSALQGHIATVITEGEGAKVLIYASPFSYEGKIVGGFRYLLNLDQHEHTLRDMQTWFIGVALGCLLIALLASYSFSFFIMKPLHALQHALKRVAVGDFSRKIKVRSHDEVRELADDFNTMSVALQEHIELLHLEQGKQKKFYDNVTHELKTPLTSIIGFSELIDKLDRIEDIHNCNVYIRKESTRLLQMVEELLRSSLKGDEAWRMHLEASNLAFIVSDSIRILEPTLRKSAIETTCSLVECEAVIDSKRTQQVLFNVIDNAIKHSECTLLNISIEQHDETSTCIIRIEDNGQGMSERCVRQLFIPIEDKEPRSITARSHGLGLLLCKQLMDLQGGRIEISSRKGHGTVVELHFNKQKKAITELLQS
ncbi:HAMP domain-containing histidine kinase [Paenibacillus sp. N1-5-1-14]|uniref:HAMP domain-containing sensor histidine kinase n=1 Tax=Paenibacillus radicibacter TaxID=2972488 RepID=UPI00215931B4|nr:HAMP domain-containing sensor histidine kinase [Paenibacillus radicibacter]MCR8644365.1 HAMP domain-containing histidine kinase [Paenibacillus radicibacter]